MAIIRLSFRARQVLGELVARSAKARQVRRAQALLWLDAGESVYQVAVRLRMSVRAIYHIVRRYQARSEEPIVARVNDGPHSGRPAAQREQVIKVLQPLLPHSPRVFGYRASVWTVPMLQQQYERRTHTSISARTIRRALHALNFRYKRPRYVLARQAAHWRQAKGG
ncbi:MAG: winged helix-turn-helix domain-containing protein [Chloroflexota bacterium]